MNTVFQGKKVAVLGLGLSGLSTVRFLLKQGIRPTLMDTRSKVSGLDGISAEKVDGIYLGELDAKRLSSMDWVLVSPGLDLTMPAIRFAMAQGTRFIGDVELFALYNKKPVIAITGSNGKSTVTSLATHMLCQSGMKAVAAGNIGLPVLDALALTDTEVYVLELSSFQLETTFNLTLLAACHLNLSEDHLDRHGTMAAYAAAKQRIYLNTQIAIYNAEDPQTVPPAHIPSQIGVSLGATATGLIEHQGETWLQLQGRPLLAVRAMSLMGRHNQFNALCAAALAAAAGADEQAIKLALQNFVALPHRCTLIAEKHGVRYINDSKATNVGATLAAIAGLRPDVRGKLILIAGGDGKGADFTELGLVLRTAIDVLITFGQDGPAIALQKPGTIEVKNLQEAVKTAVRYASAGDLVLLSPACASLDMFKNYEERGRLFAEAVQQALL